MDRIIRDYMDCEICNAEEFDKVHCPYCHENFKNFGKVKKHQRQYHKNRKQQTCHTFAAWQRSRAKKNKNKSRVDLDIMRRATAEPSVEVLQLDLSGQSRLDYVISHISAQLSVNLSSLTLLSLKGACCLSDDWLKALARCTPALQSVNLSDSPLLTHARIGILANSWGSTLKELYIDDCQRIDAELILPALKNLKHLEVLSVAGNPTISDLFVRKLVSSHGEKLKELNFANCHGLTNDSLELVGKRCTHLHSLNISILDKLTDFVLQCLADGCRNIQTLKLCRNTFSDEAIGAFLEASGMYDGSPTESCHFGWAMHCHFTLKMLSYVAELGSILVSQDNK